MFVLEDTFKKSLSFCTFGFHRQIHYIQLLDWLFSMLYCAIQIQKKKKFKKGIFQ